ncbi:nucleotide exchange factor GrpE [Desulfoscipio geothermicus]|uniref:Molecular chaperone GrpE (Heat shock protein) n=1 Tax=Desulfoscipio geothermicus DSM 3669 TaxID=1121426 RepID=A0A1I6D0P5_9FIRM|nr:nucleotide exchange factor GrpE [Desulfoscipio geothermicus]SFQ99064.1 Molecular chaperone GrpE (heat shock protein) [Desulfoscipio geothermicus DSM 3669]
MNWKFWEVKKKRDERPSPAVISEQLANIAGRLDNLEAFLKSSQQQVYHIDGQLVQNAGQLTETAAQVQKLARLHYKTGQETQSKLDRLMTGIKKVQQWQEQYLQETVQLQLKEKQITALAEAVMKQLDDIDYIRRVLKDELQDDARDNWRQMLEQWAVRLVQALAEAGILEIDLYGKSFDPRWAEAIATVTRAEALKMCTDTDADALLPYQVVEVTRRGFVTPEGRILRKAQVITVQEEDNYV